MRYVYEDANFENELAESFHKLLSLYKQLLTYVRRKLLKKYGSSVIRPDGPLPAHILGNLWAQDWSNIADIVLPYPPYKNIDVSDEMLHQSFTPLRYETRNSKLYLPLYYFEKKKVVATDFLFTNTNICILKNYSAIINVFFK